MKTKLIKIILICIAIAGIIDTIILAIRSGNVDTGILSPSIGGVFIIFLLLFIRTEHYKKKLKLYNKIGKVLLGLFIVWFISFAALTIVILTSAVSQSDEKVDSVIVLGAGLKGDKPTLVLQERLNYTIEYLNKNTDAIAVVSGGQGIGEIITEAEGMKRYLIAHGISENRIIKEEKSTSTYENMIFSKKVYEETTGKELDKVMIITNDFHMFRSKHLAKRVGLEPYGISSGTPWYIYPNVLLREYLAVIKSFIFDR
ncbi:YdcF family protein [Ruminiclostridium herbifermentans]|uniref:YdcF family protein n=1 Tax=Ruminiclostridium herbifermentans TaxID=2488810 RepID=A0A4U7JGW4_9FIRM|nr:YdcF family protein [Ruminiclostridium herbifermentans]QNU67751.1 YdcF family protein [Ruminiclostridium herbifermentans]